MKNECPQNALPVSQERSSGLRSRPKIGVRRRDLSRASAGHGLAGTAGPHGRWDDTLRIEAAASGTSSALSKDQVPAACSRPGGLVH